MAYISNYNLPEIIRNNLPDHAQTIYRKAFNTALKQYGTSPKKLAGEDLEEIAHRVAWSAVKNRYKKGFSGKWIEKSNPESN